MFNLWGIKKGEGFIVCDIFEGEGESLKFKFLKRERAKVFFPVEVLVFSLISTLIIWLTYLIERNLF